MKVVACDVDGVLNQKKPMSNGYYGIDPKCMLRLNHILNSTGARLVISSAWRYMVHEGAMTIKGFTHLFKTHGYDSQEIYGITYMDESVPTRGEQIQLFLDRYNERATNLFLSPIENYLILDDLDQEDKIRISDWHSPDHFIQTNPATGLTGDDVIRAISLLNRG